MNIDENKQPETEQKSPLPEYESRVYEVADEDSTIFSAPEAHRDRVKKGVKLKKMILAAVALVVVAAIAVTVALVVPPLVDEDDTSSTDEIDPPMMDSALFTDVDRVTLIRDDATVEFKTIQVESTTTDDEGNEVTEMTDQWALKNVDSSLTSYSTIDNTVTTFMEQHYTKKISDDKNDGNDYGFNNPEYQVDFYKKGSDEVYFSLLIGGPNPTDTGKYATTTLDDAVYFIAGVSEFYQYQKVETDFVEPESMPAISKDSDYSDDNFTEGTLVMCDKLVLDGKALGDKYTIESQDSDNITTFTAYKLTTPVSRPANDDNIGNIVALFTYGIESSGCYSYSTAEEELKKFGLDNPDFSATIYVGNIKRSFSATKQADGNYAVYHESNKTIMKVAADSLAPAAYGREELYNDLLFIENITNADKITVQSAGETLEFEILTEYDEEAQADDLTAIKYGGEEITMSDFQDYYAFLVGITAQSYDEHDTTGVEPSTVLTIHHKDGETSTVVKYFKITNARYQVETNGVKMGLISSSDHTRVMKYAKNVAEGKSYNSR